MRIRFTFRQKLTFRNNVKVNDYLSILMKKLITESSEIKIESMYVILI